MKVLLKIDYNFNDFFNSLKNVYFPSSRLNLILSIMLILSNKLFCDNYKFIIFNNNTIKPMIARNDIIPVVHPDDATEDLLAGNPDWIVLF